MKKRELKNLTLNKKTISNLKSEEVKGGITTWRFICTNHPEQHTDFCWSLNGEHSCAADCTTDCTVA